LKKIINIIALLLLIAVNLHAQIGGESTYQFLNLPNSARSSSLSGSSIGLWENDLNLAIDNPSLLDSNSHKHLALNYADYIADVNYGMAAYSQYFKGIGTFAVAINYMHYGEFEEADATGVRTGTFTASDYALNLIYSRALYPNLQVGANLKILYSNYYQYNSFGLALDAGITYHNEEKKNSVSFIIKNFGHQITPYTDGNYESLPFDMQIGYAQKLNHAPFRFLVSLHHLHNWSMAYDSPLDEDNTVLGEGEEAPSKSTFSKIGDEAIRHLNIGMEIVPGKNFYLRVGYNFQRMKEMVIDDKFGMVGFSFGAGIRIYKFHISYGRAIYHVAGGTNTFSITSNLNEFF
jgi:hypothetical protein